MISRPEPSESTLDHYAYVTVTGTGTLATLVEALGMSPDAGWDKDDLRKRGRKDRYGFTRWSLYSGLPRGAPLNDHLTQVFERLSPIEASFVALGDDWTKRISVTGTYEDPDYLVGISVRNHSRAAEFGLGYDFDFYFDDM